MNGARSLSAEFQSQGHPREGELRPDRRAMIAYVAGNLISGGHPARIFDQSRQVFLVPGFDLTMPRISLQGSQGPCRSCQSSEGTRFCLVDRNDQHVCLSVNGREFEGLDHGSRSHFSGQVLDGYISLFDHRANAYFGYQF